MVDVPHTEKYIYSGNYFYFIVHCLFYCRNTSHIYLVTPFQPATHNYEHSKVKLFVARRWIGNFLS